MAPTPLAAIAAACFRIRMQAPDNGIERAFCVGCHSETARDAKCSVLKRPGGKIAAGARNPWHPLPRAFAGAPASQPTPALQPRQAPEKTIEQEANASTEK